MICTLCNKKDFKIVKRIIQPDRFEKFLNIVNPKRYWFVCNFCNTAKNLQKKNNILNLSKISDRYYDIDIGKNELNNKFKKILSLKNSDNKNRCKRIKKFLENKKLLKKKIDLLDIGTGLGIFPYELKKDFLKHKIKNLDYTETDPYAKKHSKKVLKKNPIDLKKCKKNYDLITLNKVLEHIIDPIKFLTLIDKKILKEGKIIYIEVPCSSNLKYKKTTDNSLGSLHHNLYSKKSFFFIAKYFNYEVLECKTINEPSGKITIYAFLKKKQNTLKEVNFISNVYINKTKNLTSIFYKSKFETQIKKKYIRNKKDFLHLNIGYKINEDQGEYISILANKNQITLYSDKVGSYSLFYLQKKNSLFISNDLNYLIKKNNEIKINKKELNNFYLFGHQISNKNLIYKNIYKINSEEIYHFNSKSLFKFPKDNNLEKNLLINQNDLLELEINNRIKFFGSKIKKNFLPLTSGVDSNILFRKLKKQKINFDAGLISMKATSIEKKIALKNAKKLAIKFKIFNFSRKSSKINKLLDEYSDLTSGIGVSSEIFLLDFIKKISKKYKIVFTGFGGELSRNFFRSKNYFINNYLTEKKTLKKFTTPNSQKKIFKNLITFKKKNFNSKIFYLKKRYPNNISRKNLMIMSYIFPINFFINQELFANKKTISNNNFTKIFKINDYVKPIDIRLDDCFNVNIFFKFIKKRLIKEINTNNKLSNIGLNKKNIINSIITNELSERDKWFLLRILNLLIFLNKNSKLLI